MNQGRAPSRRARPWFAVLFVIVMLAAYSRGWLPRDVLMIYALLSLLSVVMYYRDKQAALRQRWRTPERTLHWIAFLGGWPGAMLAQYWFNHKSTKGQFRRWFWFGVISNVALLAYGLYSGDALLSRLR